MWEIIFYLGLLLSAALFHKTHPSLLKGILAALIFSMITAYLSENSVVITASYALFATVALVYSTYSALQGKWIYVVVGVFTVFYYLFTTFYWSYLPILLLLMIIPLVCYAIILRRWKSHQSNLGVLTIMASSELTWFISYFEIIN